MDWSENVHLKMCCDKKAKYYNFLPFLFVAL